MRRFGDPIPWNAKFRVRVSSYVNPGSDTNSIIFGLRSWTGQGVPNSSNTFTSGGNASIQFYPPSFISVVNTWITRTASGSTFSNSLLGEVQSYPYYAFYMYVQQTGTRPPIGVVEFDYLDMIPYEL